MRIMPNMTVIVPCDALEAKRATIEAAAIKGPVYIRLGRSGMPVITKESDAFKIGKANTIREGRDISIVACGQMVYESMLACDELKKEGIDARLINIHTPKPIDKDCIIAAAKQTKAMVVVEEHTVAGGLGSAIAEVLAEDYPVPIKFVGIRDKFGLSGEPDELFEHFGLKSKYIVKAAKEAIGMKR
jgi:transketolase